MSILDFNEETLTIEQLCADGWGYFPNSLHYGDKCLKTLKVFGWNKFHPKSYICLSYIFNIKKKYLRILPHHGYSNFSLCVNIDRFETKINDIYELRMYYSEEFARTLIHLDEKKFKIFYKSLY